MVERRSRHAQHTHQRRCARQQLPRQQLPRQQQQPCCRACTAAARRERSAPCSRPCSRAAQTVACAPAPAQQPPPPRRPRTITRCCPSRAARATRTSKRLITSSPRSTTQTPTRCGARCARGKAAAGARGAHAACCSRGGSHSSSAAPRPCAPPLPPSLLFCSLPSAHHPSPSLPFCLIPFSLSPSLSASAAFAPPFLGQPRGVQALHRGLQGVRDAARPGEAPPV